MKLPASILVLALSLNFGWSDGAKSKDGSATAAGWKPLFDGKTLNGWKESDFSTQAGAKADPKFQGGGPAIVLEQGESLSGITYTNPVPKVNYEIALEAMRINGSDFFCGLTLPYKEAHFTLLFGGWGGAVTGISSIDSSDASENETTKFVKYDANKWYRIRCRVTDTRIEAWLDDEKITDLDTTDKKISMRPGEIENAVPMGIATYQTRAACREIKLRTVAK